MNRILSCLLGLMVFASIIALAQSTPVHLSDGTLRCIRFQSTLNGVIVGSLGTIFTTTNGGESWTKGDSLTGANLRHVWFVNQDTGYVVGYGGSSGPSSAILRTVNGGTTWSLLAVDSTCALRYITFISSDTGFACGARTIPDSALGYSVTEGVVLRTVDAGLTWTQISTVPRSTLTAIRFVDSQLGYAVAWEDATFQTRDGGHSWTRMNDPYYWWPRLYQIELLSADVALLFGSAIVRTSDAGQTWQFPYLQQPLWESFGASLVSHHELVAVGDWGLLLTSADSGATWLKHDLGTTSTFYSVAFSTRQRGFIVTQDGNLLRINFDELRATTFAPQDVQSIQPELSSHPNPFNPQTMITATVPEQQSISLQVFDVMGRIVATLESNTVDAGVHRYSWNATSCAAGLYICRLTAGGVNRYTKLLLVR